MNTEFTITGGADVVAKLNRLGRNIERKIGVKALRAGLTIIRAGAIRNAPVGIYLYPSQQARRQPGTLKRGIKIRAGRRRADEINLRVGVGKKWFSGDEWYAAFVEFGHRAGKRRGGKRVTGTSLDKRPFVEGEHFIEYAYDELKAPAIAAIHTTFLSELETQAAIH